MAEPMHSAAGIRDRASARAALRTWLGVACALWTLAGCSKEVAIVGLLPDDSGDAAASSPWLDAGGLQPDSAAGGRDADSSDAAGDRAVLDPCLNGLAARTFRQALCACSDVTIATGGLHTDAFDSTQGAYRLESALQVGSDVGVNGRFGAIDLLTNVVSIGGNLVVLGALGPAFATDLSFLPALAIQGDLRVGGPLSYTNEVEVAGNLWLGSDLEGSAPLRVHGDMRQPPTAARRSSAPIAIDGRDLREPVSIAPPCPCDQEQIVDVAAAVGSANARNDNALYGFDSNALAAVIADQVQPLPAGRMFASTINVAGNLTLMVDGRSALFVAGEMNIAGSLDLQIGPEGRLDIFVAGAFNFGALESLGELTRPSQLRIYVARDQRVTLGLPAFFAGNLYAAEADVEMTATQVVYGAIFARALSTPLPLEIHYDRSIQREELECAGSP